MSHPANESWAQACYEHFIGATDEGNYALAKACIADMFDVFPEQARGMALELRSMPVEKFSHPSNKPYI